MAKPSPDIIVGMGDISAIKKGAHIILMIKGRALWLLPQQAEVISLIISEAAKTEKKVVYDDVKHLAKEERSLWPQ